MTRSVSMVAIGSVLAVGQVAAAADPAEKTPPVITVSGLLVGNYTVSLTEDAAGDVPLDNSFNLDRTYVKVDAKLTDALSTRVTLDSGRESVQTVVDASGASIVVPEDLRYRVFVKHAWLEWKASSDVSIKGGMVDTVLIPFQENFTGLRWIGKLFLDELRLETTTDLGVNVSGKHGKGRVSWAAGVYNGETFIAPEAGSGKSLQARVTVDPLTGEGKKVSMPISVFIDENLQQDDVPGVLTWAGNVGFKHPNFLFLGEVVGRSFDGVSGLGQGIQIIPRVPDVGFLLVRLDRLDPNTDVADDGVMRILAGPGHDFYDKVSLALLYDRYMYEASDIPAHGVVLKAQAGF